MCGNEMAHGVVCHFVCLWPASFCVVLKGIYLYLLSVVAAQSIVLDGTTSFHRFKYGVFS